MGGKPRPELAKPHDDRVRRILEVLAQTWPEATCELDHKDDYQLLVATMLAAQSTDKMINKISPALFARYPTATDLARADPAELEALVHSSGFFRAKARNLRAMANTVVTEHGGRLPRTMEGLVGLPGVARKTANVVLGTAHGIASGIVVDTHVKRVAGRLDLTRETDPVKIERDLMAKIPRDRWISFANQLIWHGRRICHAKKPACNECPLAPLCPSAEI